MIAVELTILNSTIVALWKSQPRKHQFNNNEINIHRAKSIPSDVSMKKSGV